MKILLVRRERWREDLDSIRRMHGRVLEAEAILAGSWASADAAVTNAGVAARFDAWVAALRQEVGREVVPETERRCLQHFLDVTTNLRPQLIQCYDLAGLPRTNNDMEGFIRGIKTRYRRLSGRKNWNRYLLRYGRRVAFYEAQVRTEGGQAGVEEGIRRVAPGRWRAVRAEQQARQENQLKQYRFRHKRAKFLQGLEARWTEAAQRTALLP